MNKNWRWERNQERWGTRVGRMVWDFLGGSEIMGYIDIALEYVEALEKAVGTERPEKEAE